MLLEVAFVRDWEVGGNVMVNISRHACRRGKGTVALALLVCLALSSLIGQNPASPSGLPMQSFGIQSTPLSSAPNTSVSPYDEQVGVTFTQDYSMLAFNVSAVDYTDNNIGPGYFVNGLTDQGYWYQVGLSFNWPMTNGAVNPGFNMNYEVFSPGPRSIYPTDNGGGLWPFNGTVNTGDSVLLSLSFSQGSVVMNAIDWQTRSVSQQSYLAYANNQVFVGLASAPAQSGFFSGLMTEQYHYTPFYGSGTPVTYSVSGSQLSSVWMWMDEWDTNTNTISGRVFAANTTSPVLLEGSIGTYFTSNGTAEIATAHSLVTGLTPVVFPKLIAGSQSTGQPGHQASINLEVAGQSGAILHFENITVSTSFAKYNFTLGIGQNSLALSVPSSLTLGTYNLTVNVRSWEYFDNEAQLWIPLRPDAVNETLLVTNHPAPSTSSGPSSSSSGRSSSTHTTTITLYSILAIIRSLIIPAIGSYVALVLLAIGLLIRQNRKNSKNV